MIWGGSKLLPEKWLDALRFSVKIETVFSAQIKVFSKKKKKKVFPEIWTVFPVQMKVFSKKKKKKKKKKVFPEIWTVFPVQMKVFSRKKKKKGLHRN